MAIFSRERRGGKHLDGKLVVRLLSEHVVQSIDNPSEASERQTELVNAYRLLDRYRYNCLGRDVERRHLHEVMERTRMEVFPRTKGRRAINYMMDTLGNLAFPEKYEKPNRRYFQKTRRFFERLKEKVSH